MTDKPPSSIRLNVQQAAHCSLEALSVIEQEEDIRHAVYALVKASMLIESVLVRIREEEEGKGAA